MYVYLHSRIWTYNLWTILLILIGCGRSICTTTQGYEPYMLLLHHARDFKYCCDAQSRTGYLVGYEPRMIYISVSLRHDDILLVYSWMDLNHRLFVYKTNILTYWITRAFLYRVWDSNPRLILLRMPAWKAGDLTTCQTLQISSITITQIDIVIL